MVEEYKVKLTKQAITDKENPFWKDFFKERTKSKN